jgi:hypothetical protein
MVARRFIAGLPIDMICVPEGRLRLDLGCYETDVPDRFKVKISTRPPSEFRRPSRTQATWVQDPGDKSLGYCHVSFRDAFSPAS